MESIQLLGLTLELIFLFIGVYLYLFSAGFIKGIPMRNPAEMEKFRNENGRWLRILSLLLAAIMIVNIAMRFMGS